MVDIAQTPNSLLDEARLEYLDGGVFGELPDDPPRLDRMPEAELRSWAREQYDKPDHGVRTIIVRLFEEPEQLGGAVALFVTRFFVPLSKTEAGAPPILESDYRYPGPKPSIRITGILMLADAVEAASRTLVEPTPAKIAAMVRAIGSDCLRDGQFDSCDLTIGDLTAIQESLIRTVTTMFHHRIDYPGFDFNARQEAEPRSRRGSGTVRLHVK